MNYLNNAFSLGMVQPGCAAVCERLPAGEQVPADAVSNVGHADAAALFTQLLGRPVLMNRVTTQLGPDDVLYVGQYKGPRLPEGAVSLPAGAIIEWWRVGIEPELV